MADYRRNFSLIELLVVIAIIAILASASALTLHVARNKGKQARCLNNLRQLSMAFEMYSQDHRGFLPWYWNGGGGNGRTGGWVYYTNFTGSSYANFDVSRGTVFNYLSDDVDVFRCLSDVTDSQCSYGANSHTRGPNRPKRIQDIDTNPSILPLLLEEGCVAPTSNDGYFDVEGYDFNGDGVLNYDRVVNRHADGSVYLFADGHVKWLQLDYFQVVEACRGNGLP